MSLEYRSIELVDDEEDIVNLFTEAITDAGYHIIGFYSPIFILEYIRQHPKEFGLVILDYKMVPMQGCELANKITSINPKIKMIILTAYGDIVNNVLKLKVVKKPIRLDKLLQVVERNMNYVIIKE